LENQLSLGWILCWNSPYWVGKTKLKINQDKSLGNCSAPIFAEPQFRSAATILAICRPPRRSKETFKNSISSIPRFANYNIMQLIKTSILILVTLTLSAFTIPLQPLPSSTPQSYQKIEQNLDPRSVARDVAIKGTKQGQLKGSK
jgi:hypothetical protein